MTKPRSWGLLILLLLTFARLTFSLGTKNLWLDESFSLQRAESNWPALVAGSVDIVDGVDAVNTIDQHPFAFFAILGLMLRLAGTSEFALRFPSVMAATLIVPAAWILARRLERYRALPPGTSAWAAFLAALNPFYLWFGQRIAAPTGTGIYSAILLQRACF
jgi:4-amino-4-deoxy-L-arabinose transferase-like glycosyltransferase